jgi:hypothetical protein
MPPKRNVSTAIGQPIALETPPRGLEIQLGRPPVVLQTQPVAYIPLERPEELQQWEDDLRKFYGVSLDASGLRGRACETCSCGCTDDCGLL